MIAITENPNSREGGGSYPGISDHTRFQNSRHISGSEWSHQSDDSRPNTHYDSPGWWEKDPLLH